MSRTVPGIIFAILGAVGVILAFILGASPVGACGSFFAPGPDGIFCAGDIAQRALGFWLLLLASLAVLIISTLNALSAAKIEREDAIPKTATTPAPARSESIADTIARLEEMRVAGVLDDVEFAEAKRKALGG